MSRDRIKTNADRKVVAEHTTAMLNKIWPTTLLATEHQELGPLEPLLVTSVNSVLDAHTYRISAAFDKLPLVVMVMLYLISAASLSVVGYNAGIQGRISRWRTGTFALVLSGLMMVILDYDRAIDGFVTVNQESIQSVIAYMEANLEL